MDIKDAIQMMEYRIETATQIAGKGENGKAFEDMEMAMKALENQEKIIEVLRDTRISDEETIDKIIQIVGIHI